MADGSTKPISEVKVGDRVLAAHEVTGEITVSPVTGVIIGDGLKDLVTLSVDADGDGRSQRITATAEHPFYAQGRGWVNASEPRTGEHLMTPEGPVPAVTGTSRTQEIRTVHNLTVAGSHTFFVVADGQSALVHNCARRIPKKRGWKDLRTPTKYKSKAAAIAAARRDARMGGRCRYRGVCSSNNHVHVDYFNKRGQISHTRHYNW
ncbi:polymorphic toxin-type HINT domain-containing protein [Streptomyces chitinivorans]|uniref:Polymorphic toxin-type HINT domain-containing protein n=1 Tax=Streptomyces chitinivorans TaxID=1257027 RepID=A0ABW7HMY8_9ACTN|nr:polymorphic toxin-type HINT domain-containing protein [Streptomyces chitinivorans]MDH2410859.1 polymorphic toxin-type HINT domain-containing protein [Streptomyces chitinivorans]